MKIQPFKKHILINSLHRSGGSLLARLFDDYPNCYSLPFEYQYNIGPKVNFPFDEIVSNNDRLALIKKNFEKYQNKNHFSKDKQNNFRFNFDYKSFKKRCNSDFKKLNNKCTHNIFLPIVLTNFYNSLGFEVKPDLLVNHLSMSFMANPQEFFNLYKNSYIIQTTRDFFSWYCSVKYHFQIPKEDYLYIDVCFNLWKFSNTIGLLNSNKFQNYYTLSYEDIVKNKTQVLKSLAAKIGIKYDKNLINPTLFGQPWLGNSSIDREIGGIKNSQLNRYEVKLTKNEKDYIFSLLNNQIETDQVLLNSKNYEKIVNREYGNLIYQIYNINLLKRTRRFQKNFIQNFFNIFQ